MPVDREIYKKPFWMLPLTQVYADLATGEKGLAEAEAKRRIAIFGKNTLEQKNKISHFAIFARQFKNPLIFILLIAGGLTIVAKDLNDAIFIILAALVNAALGYYQEQKAEAALEHLKTYITKRIRVIRDGVEREIDTDDLVPGDVIHVTQGDRIPADARLTHVSDLDVDQSILTGESLPVHKTNREAPERAAVAEQHCMIFGGTSVVQGFGTAIVTATDQNTQLGKIATLVSESAAEPTPLQKALSDFSMRAMGFILALAIMLFFVAFVQGIPKIDAFLIAVAVLVAAVPEGLPIVITVILAVGVQRLAKRKGVVRRLSAAETLGSTSIILTDKTGTLTQAKMSLSGITIFEPDPTVKDSISPEEFLLHTALLNVDVVVENPRDHHSGWRLLGKPLEVALVKAAAERNIPFPTLKEDKEALHILPFNSLNKFSASLYKMPASWFRSRFKKPEPYVLSILGAPEMLLKLSDISPAEHERILSAVNAMAVAGERVVGVAVKEVDSIENFHLKDHTHLHGLRFLGTLSLRDPLRPTVKSAIQAVERAGIRVVIVTGDHEGTAASIARELGMVIGPENIIDGSLLDAMDEDELHARLAPLKIVARVSPEGKLKIVRAFQAEGEIVAMNGDGINDAPALKQANVGVAMGTGTDVSQDVADLVLLDDNFETIVEAITEGRRILGNIRKAIVYLTSTLFNEIFLIGGSLIVGLAVPINPLQILWINLFTDSFPGIALAFEKGVDVTRAPRHKRVGVLTSEMKFLMTVNGIVSSILLYGTYDILLRLGFDPPLVRTFIFAALGTYSLFVVLAIRSLKRTIFSYNPFSNRYLTASIVFGIGLTLAGVYIPFFQRYFETVSLPPLWLLGVFIFGIFNVLLVELTKMVFHREMD